jgi:hypothetical protein
MALGNRELTRPSTFGSSRSRDNVLAKYVVDLRRIPDLSRYANAWHLDAGLLYYTGIKFNVGPEFLFPIRKTLSTRNNDYIQAPDDSARRAIVRQVHDNLNNEEARARQDISRLLTIATYARIEIDDGLRNIESFINDHRDTQFEQLSGSEIQQLAREWRDIAQRSATTLLDRVLRVLPSDEQLFLLPRGDTMPASMVDSVTSRILRSGEAHVNPNRMRRGNEEAIHQLKLWRDQKLRLRAQDLLQTLQGNPPRAGSSASPDIDRAVDEFTTLIQQPRFVDEIVKYGDLHGAPLVEALASSQDGRALLNAAASLVGIAAVRDDPSRLAWTVSPYSRYGDDGQPLPEEDQRCVSVAVLILT